MPTQPYTSIREFFSTDRVHDALIAYGKFAQSGAWRIDHKIELYQRATTAFEGSADDDARRRAFASVYDDLRKYWQVFRGGRTRWTSSETFDALQDLLGCTRGTPEVALPNIAASPHLTHVVEAVFQLRGIKGVSNTRPVTMAISKFLHFYNPRLFPIYDTAVIENKVLSRFAQEWNIFDQRIDVSNLHFPTSYYVRYICWLGSMIASETDSIMSVFSDWVRAEVRRLNPMIRVPEAIDSYYATAAEIIAIGSWRATTR